MKVFQIIDTLRSGGKERQVVEVLKFFSKKKNWQTGLVVLSDEVHYDYINELNIPVFKIVRRYPKDPLVFFRLYKLFKKTKPSVIHSWSPMCSIYAIFVTKLLGIKFVNGFLRAAPPKLDWNDKTWMIAKLTFPFSDKIVANSMAGLSAYNVSLKKGSCLYNGFDFGRLHNIKPRKLILEQFDIKTPYVVGMVATFSNKKDYDTFFKAARIILEQRNDVTFVAVGDGKNFDCYKNKIPAGVKANIKLLGKQKRVLNIINVFDIGVLTTNTKYHSEGISNAIMECMAMQKPVIATDCGGNRELLINNHTGFLVEPFKPIQVSERISHLLDDKQLAEHLGQNGFNQLEKKFNLKVMGKAFVELYNSIEVK